MRPTFILPTHLVTLALGLSLLGCGGQAVRCTQDSECPSGNRCESGECAQRPGVDAGMRDAGGGERCTPGTQCRARAGDCDVPEECPSSGVCPSDALLAADSICRAPTAACDLAERCDGTNAACPADGLAPSTMVCRGSAGGCDVEERCSGSSAECPADALSGQGTVCRPVGGSCDVEERCDGATVGCPADQFLGGATSCRAAVGICDVEETCTGAAAACPPDARRAPGFACRPAISACDAEEVCDGATTSCPADVAQPGTMQCAPQSCMAGVTTPARFCSGGAPTCSASSTPISCNGYQCNGQTCASSCTSSSDCLSTHFCQPGGQCAPKRVDGQSCTNAASGAECQSGVCMGTSADTDGDGFGAGPVTFECGTLIFAGRSTLNTDCCDSDARAFPGATSYQTTARACGGFDFNCDGQSSLEFVQTNACQSTACGVGCNGNPGWQGSNPACGTVATYVTICGVLLCAPGSHTRCAPIIESRTQSCR